MLHYNRATINIMLCYRRWQRQSFHKVSVDSGEKWSFEKSHAVLLANQSATIHHGIIIILVSRALSAANYTAYEDAYTNYIVIEQISVSDVRNKLVETTGQLEGVSRWNFNISGFIKHFGLLSHCNIYYLLLLTIESNIPTARLRFCPNAFMLFKKENM